MKISAKILWICVFLGLWCSCTDPNSSASDAGPQDAMAAVCEGSRKSDRSLFWVYNGTRSPTQIPLTDRQQQSVVAITGGIACSGALVSNSAVLTAKHCTENHVPTDFSVRFGQDDQHPDEEIAVVTKSEHQSQDLALLVLHRAPNTAQPIFINPEPLDRSWIGTRVEAAGYGETAPGVAGDGRYFVAEPIHDVTSSMVSVDGEGVHGVCFGDSGGPLLAVVGQSSVRVLAALSRGDESCSGIDHFTRTDAVRHWIEQTTGPTPPIDTDMCGLVSPEGYCDSGRATYCSQGTRQIDYCEDLGQVCGYSTLEQGFRCVEPGADPCNGIDRTGQCQGALLTWCGAGQLRSFDCLRCDMGCSWAGQGIGYECVADICLGLDYNGRCNGNVAEWCEDGQLRWRNCGDNTCRWVGGGRGYYCDG